MPTSNLKLSSEKVSVTELKLNLSESKSATSVSAPVFIRKPSARKTPHTFDYCGEPKKPVRLSTLSVQVLQYKEPNTKPIFTVKPYPVKIKDDSSKSTPVRKKRGYDFTSSTNSNFEGWIFTAPTRLKRKCSSNSTSDTKANDVSNTNIAKSTSKQLQPLKESDATVTSREMVDSAHKASIKRLNFKGPEWQKPCKESFVAGAPRAFIGHCPYNNQQLSNMSRAHQKFFLTLDPRKKYCLRNPAMLRQKAYSVKKEFAALTKMIKHADNVCAASASESSESFICEVIDLDNPLQLDFQGMDYRNTYQTDEQDIHNQQVYQRIVRYIDRKKIKKEIADMVEQQAQKEQLAIPPCFEVIDRNTPSSPPPSEESIHFGKLYRTLDKPYTKKKLRIEKENRYQRYRENHLLLEARNIQREKERALKEKQAQEDLAATLAVDGFYEYVDNINEAFQRSFFKENKMERKVKEVRKFPHTMRETLQFKRKLKAQNLVKRDEARVKQEFFRERLGIDKQYAEANLEISSDSPRRSSDQPISEQSTNDEDTMKVGKEGNVFKLRGFHFKLGSNIRGKRHQIEQQGQHTEKGCITRDQWLQQLAPKKEPVKLDLEVGIEKIRSPDDPNLDLFPPIFGTRPPQVKSSAVHNYVVKRLGRHYDRVLRKNLKLVKPRLHYAVKKFNLISFLYGDTDRKALKAEHLKRDLEAMQRTAQSTQEYMVAKEHLKKLQHQEIKSKRLQLLGIPCKEIKKSRLQTLCELSESSTDSDWVPDPEPTLSSPNSPHETVSENKPKLSLQQLGNMPAPKYRESTLRVHPRRPRDYLKMRVPSGIFNQTVRQTGLPHLRKLVPDDQVYANVRQKKSEYTDKFEARHHHDHWIPTQKKFVDICYQPKVVHPEVTKVKTKSQKDIIKNFQMANPPCNAFVDMDLTMPNFDTQAMIAEYQKKSKPNSGQVEKEFTKDICFSRDFVFHSRPEVNFDEIDYPGRQEYLQFLQEVRQALYEAKPVDDGEEKLCVDKQALIKELEEDLKSIESCLSSKNSSECTNFTNDSGSFLLMDGVTKVPLDYIRKALVPFEELQRSRFKVEPIDVDTEEANPFRVMPFVGQHRDQIKLAVAKDSFFTFTTRLQNGLRLRLEVPAVDVQKRLIGRGANKFLGAVTTDIDENYVSQLKIRPPLTMFNFKTGRSFIKDALRLKFESLVISGQIVRTKIYDRLNDQHWENMQKTKILYEKLFEKWQSKEYAASMGIVYEVKSYYEMTDLLRREFRELERQQLLLNLDIVFIEGHWIRRIMLQNFHYLLAEQDWRHANDWIHRVIKSKKENHLNKNLSQFKNEGNDVDKIEQNDDDDESKENSDMVDTELESFEESIAKRNIVNIRVRDKDDAWAIKAFYEDVYMKNKHPLEFVFPDNESFLQGIENLKVKTFVLLLELHFTMSIHTELQVRLETFEEWCIEDLKDKEQYVARKCAKKYFMADRAMKMENSTLDFINVPVETSFNDQEFNRNRAVIAEVWRSVVPINVRGSSDQEPEPIEMVAMMSNVVLELIGKFETIDIELAHKIDGELRRRRAYQRKLSYQAYQVERRIEMEMKKVRKNLEPPFQKPKRVGKLPHFLIKKKKQSFLLEEKHISEHTKFFFRAFHDEGDVMQIGDARESLCVVDNMQEQIVPFYFDHFLKINGYSPNYNFKTQVELRDGAELNRLKIKQLVPEVIERVERWEQLKNKTMNENIQRNPKMYENVNF